MSWFDAASLAGFAKSAFKEAQKTIDKALDLGEEDEGTKSTDSIIGSDQRDSEKQVLCPNKSNKSDNVLGSLNTTLFRGSPEQIPEREKFEQTDEVSLHDECVADVLDESTVERNCDEDPAIIDMAIVAVANSALPQKSSTPVVVRQDLSDISVMEEDFQSCVLAVESAGTSRNHEHISHTSSSTPAGRKKTVSDSELYSVSAEKSAIERADYINRSRASSGVDGLSAGKLSNLLPSPSDHVLTTDEHRSFESVDSLTSSNSSCRTLVISHPSASNPDSSSISCTDRARTEFQDRMSETVAVPANADSHSAQNDGAVMSALSTAADQSRDWLSKDAVENCTAQMADNNRHYPEAAIDTSSTGNCAAHQSLPICDHEELCSLATEDQTVEFLEIDTKSANSAANDSYSPSTMASSVEILERGISPSDEIPVLSTVSCAEERHASAEMELSGSVCRQQSDTSVNTITVPVPLVQEPLTDCLIRQVDVEQAIPIQGAGILDDHPAEHMLDRCAYQVADSSDVGRSFDVHEADAEDSTESPTGHDIGSNSPDSELAISSSRTSIDGIGGAGGPGCFAGGTETTASSDVEILASPGGDCRTAEFLRQLSSSRCAASSLPRGAVGCSSDKSHSRQLSQTSVASCDSDFTGAGGHLTRRIRHLEETVAARETKLIELSQHNVCLQEENNNLSSRLEHYEHISKESATNAGSERKITQLKTERDRLQAQLNEKQKSCSKEHMPLAEYREILSEKDTIIGELRAEGEKLSKEQLRYNTIIKKLRSRDQEREAELKKLSSKLSSSSAEIESLKKRVAESANELRLRDTEYAQAQRQHEVALKEASEATSARSEAVSRTSQLEEQLQKTQSELSALKERVEASEKSAADALAAAAVDAELRAAVEKNQQTMIVERDELLLQLQSLRDVVRRTERQLADREDALRAENVALERRLFEAEQRGEQLPAAIAAATEPLRRQLETTAADERRLKDQLRQSLAAADARNEQLSREVQRLSQTEHSLTRLCDSASEQQRLTDTKLSQLSQQLTEAIRRAETAESETSRLQQTKSSSDHQVRFLSEECRNLRERLSSAVAAASAEKERALTLRRQLAELEDKSVHVAPSLSRSQSERSCSASHISTPCTSPTPSLSRISLNSSATATLAPLAAISVTESSCSSLVAMTTDSAWAGAAAVETFTSQLQQRDGELRQLRSERRQLSNQLQQLSDQLQQAETARQQLTSVSQQLRQLQTSYDQLLQMYGEKEEQNEELKMDLADIKLAYRQQIDSLLTDTATSAGSRSHS